MTPTDALNLISTAKFNGSRGIVWKKFIAMKLSLGHNALNKNKYNTHPLNCGVEWSFRCENPNLVIMSLHLPTRLWRTTDPLLLIKSHIIICKFFDTTCKRRRDRLCIQRRYTPTNFDRTCPGYFTEPRVTIYFHTNLKNDTETRNTPQAGIACPRIILHLISRPVSLAYLPVTQTDP